MSERSTPSTYDKVLQLNLDEPVYGTFAEIGAGQEVANWFFRSSGTAGSMAKSISAYAMNMSDAIYGKTERYVSRARLRSMLDHEFGLLTERLAGPRGDRSTFFSFCNTVRARGYQDEGECHGWLGVRLQVRPHGEPNDILVHLRLLDDDNVDQMEALGIVGVNLLYAAFYHRADLAAFVDSLVDELHGHRVEIDMLSFSGPDFGFVDNRLCALQLVQSGLTPVAMFSPEGVVVQSAEVLYRRPVLLLRGSFNPVTRLHLDMLQQARDLTRRDLGEEEAERAVEVCEITMNNLLRDGGGVDHLDFLTRADALQAMGKHVLVSSSPEFHRIVSVLNLYTHEPIGVILSIGLLNELFKPKWSAHLEGGILESFGRLFKNEVRLLVYPWRNRKSGELVTASTFIAPESLEHLYRHFYENGLVRDLPCGDEALLAYTPRDLERLRADGDPVWKKFVPPEVIESDSRKGPA